MSKLFPTLPTQKFLSRVPSKFHSKLEGKEKIKEIKMKTTHSNKNKDQKEKSQYALGQKLPLSNRLLLFRN